MIQATILSVEFKPPLGFTVLEQGFKGGSSPKSKVLGGCNGTFVTTKSEYLSDLTAIVQLENQEILEIPIKHAIRQATGWEKITNKRAGLITKKFPSNVSVSQDESNGYWYISNEDMQIWAGMIS